MSDSYKIYASKDYVDSKGLPEGQGAYQQLVTDANGVAKWEDKLAYTFTSLTTIVPTTTVSSGDPIDIEAVEGQTYTVVFDDIEYTCVGKTEYITNSTVIGNAYLVYSGGLNVDSGEPFVIKGNRTITCEDASTTHTIRIDTVVTSHIPINEVYIPETIARTSDVILTSRLGDNINLSNYTLVSNDNASIGHGNEYDWVVKPYCPPAMDVDISKVTNDDGSKVWSADRTYDEMYEHVSTLGGSLIAHVDLSGTRVIAHLSYFNSSNIVFTGFSTFLRNSSENLMEICQVQINANGPVTVYELNVPINYIGLA